MGLITHLLWLQCWEQPLSDAPHSKPPRGSQRSVLTLLRPSAMQTMTCVQESRVCRDRNGCTLWKMGQGLQVICKANAWGLTGALEWGTWGFELGKGCRRADFTLLLLQRSVHACYKDIKTCRPRSLGVRREPLFWLSCFNFCFPFDKPEQ